MFDIIILGGDYVLGDTRICKDCGKEFDIKDMAKGKTRGIEYIRKQCKTCFNFQSNRNRKKTDKQYTPRSNIQEGMMNKLSEDQFVKLEKLINKSDDILKLLNNKISLDEINKDTYKEKISITIDKPILDRLKQYKKHNDVNMSELINILLRKAIKYLDWFFYAYAILFFIIPKIIK